MDDPGFETGAEDAMAVEWFDFEPASFERAKEEGDPILLSISTPWCLPCREMDREVYGNESLAERIEEGFVPIRVDGDRRPRVRDRYTMGGFPSTVFLTPHGELLTGATQFELESFRGVLDRVEEMWEEGGTEAGRVPRSVRTTPPAGEVSPEIEVQVAERLREAFDGQHGGWGEEAKFPLPGAVEFTLARDPELATRTLDPIRQHLRDTADGGFFRYASRRDWSEPQREKLLDANAALLRVFANGYLHTGDEAYRETADGLVSFLTSTLWADGGFAASQIPGPPEFYRRESGERGEFELDTDETFLTDRNALAVDALLTYFAYTDDEGARQYAGRALDSVTEMIDQDGCVRHHPEEGSPEGVLLDQARVIQALATAAETIDRSYATDAEPVAEYAIETLRTDDGFVDGVGGPGLLDRPLYPIDPSAEFADALVDLWALTGKDRYRETARDALAAFAGAADRFGPEQAGYARAVSRVCDPPLRIEVATEPGSDLHRAALRIADHEKVVVPGSGGERGTATVIVDGEPGDAVSDPEALVAQVEKRVE